MEREARNVRAKQEQGTERKKMCQSSVLKETDNKYDKVTMRNRMPAQNCKRPWNHIQLTVNKLQPPMNEKYGRGDQPPMNKSYLRLTINELLMPMNKNYLQLTVNKQQPPMNKKNLPLIL